MHGITCILCLFVCLNGLYRLTNENNMYHNIIFAISTSKLSKKSEWPLHLNRNRNQPDNVNFAVTRVLHSCERGGEKTTFSEIYNFFVGMM